MTTARKKARPGRRPAKTGAKANMKADDGKLAALPIRLCEPHPDLQTRLRYDQVDELADDIRANGQLQPGRAVEKPDGTGYLVYMGIGRLLAIKKLYEKYGEPKSYFALLDEAELPFINLFLRSMAENLRRRNLSVLEEVRSYYLASRRASEGEMVRAASKIGESAAAVKKKVELARIFGDKLEKLYEIERRAGFSFQLAHLEVFSKISDERTLYEAAAVTACSRFSAEEIEPSIRTNAVSGLVASLAPWFVEIFPQYAQRGGGGSGNGGSTHPSNEAHDHYSRSHSQKNQPHGTRSSPKDSGGGVGHGSPPENVPYKDDMPFVACPHCEAQIPLEFKEDSELTLYRFEGAAVPRKDSASPEGAYRRRCNCVNPDCRKDLWLLVSSIGGTMNAEAMKRESEEDAFRLPTARPRVGSIGWNNKRQSWVVKEGDEAEAKLYLYGNDRKFVEMAG